MAECKCCVGSERRKGTGFCSCLQGPAQGPDVIWVRQWWRRETQVKFCRKDKRCHTPRWQAAALMDRSEKHTLQSPKASCFQTSPHWQSASSSCFASLPQKLITQPAMLQCLRTRGTSGGRTDPCSLCCHIPLEQASSKEGRSSAALVGWPHWDEKSLSCSMGLQGCKTCLTS